MRPSTAATANVTPKKYPNTQIPRRQPRPSGGDILNSHRSPETRNGRLNQPQADCSPGFRATTVAYQQSRTTNTSIKKRKV